MEKCARVGGGGDKKAWVYHTNTITVDHGESAPHYPLPLSVSQKDVSVLSPDFSVLDGFDLRSAIYHFLDGLASAVQASQTTRIYGFSLCQWHIDKV